MVKRLPLLLVVLLSGCATTDRMGEWANRHPALTKIGGVVIFAALVAAAEDGNETSRGPVPPPQDCDPLPGACP